MENLFAGVPANVRQLIDLVGIAEPQSGEEDVDAIYERNKEGKCLTCSAELGNDALLVINNRGIVAIYCGGACFSDMAVLGWLEEHHGDIVDQVKFRGGEVDGDAPDGE